MAMTTTGMGDAVYTYISTTNPKFSSMSVSEKAALKTALEGLYGAQTAYIQANADVKTGIAVSTSGGSGATTAPGQIE